MNLNEKAHDLSRRLFALCGELSDLNIEAGNAIDFDAAAELSAAVHAVKVAQAQFAACDVVIDACRDRKDQSHAVKAAD